MTTDANKFQAGQEVSIKKEWQDAGDEDFKHTVVWCDRERTMIKTDIPSMTIKPTQVVLTEWLEAK